MPVLDVEKLAQNRINAIQSYHQDIARLEKAELDVSGGIDSAVMLMLLSKALGPSNVTAVYSSINSSQESLRRARQIAKAANVHLFELDLSDAYDAMVAQCIGKFAQKEGGDYKEVLERIKKDPTIKGSFRSCLRAPVGRFMNRLSGGGIRHGTGNEDEDRWLRFYQKGGDGEVDTNPLAMLSKGEVYQLAVYLGVPEDIITCKPTPDLWGTGEEHNDEEELSRLAGVEWTYSKVDPKTGEYISVGSIEAMSRFVDEHEFRLNSGDNISFFHRFFATCDLEVIHNILLVKRKWPSLTVEHLQSARKLEKSSRHKENPNCPTLGKREYLLRDAILTDELPIL